MLVGGLIFQRIGQHPENATVLTLSVHGLDSGCVTLWTPIDWTDLGTELPVVAVCFQYAMVACVRAFFNAVVWAAGSPEGCRAKLWRRWGRYFG